MGDYEHRSAFVGVDQRAGVRVVTLCGEQDVSSCDRIAAACEGPPQATVFDLTAATFIDSEVIAELVAAHTVSHLHGFAVAANPYSDVSHILELCLLATIVPITDDVSEAIRVATSTSTMTA